MNPGYPTEAYPAEAVALQDGGNYGFHGQPGGPRVVQHTTVNILSEPQKDHLVWSLCSFVYGNICCLGLAALIFSVKARDQKLVGDLTGARQYAYTACILNIVATVLISLIILSFIISIIVYFVQVKRYAPHTYY